MTRKEVLDMKRIDGKKDIMRAMVLVVGLLAAGVAAAQSPSDAYLPTVQVGVPNLSATSAKILAPTFTVAVLGSDPDSPSGLPAQWRILMVSAQYGGTAQDPSYVRTPAEYEQYGGTWWPGIALNGVHGFPIRKIREDNKITFPDMPAGEYFLWPSQVMDADGAVSINPRLSDGGVEPLDAGRIFHAPRVHRLRTLPGLSGAHARQYEMAAGQPLNFSWIASADHYGGEIVSYRHGWDLD